MNFKLLIPLFLSLFAFCSIAQAEPEKAADLKIEWCRLQHPGTVTMDAGKRSEPIYGQIYIPNCTEGEKVCKGVKAEVCIASKDDSKKKSCFPANINPKFRTDTNNDEYMMEVYAADPGEYYLLYQFSVDEGRNWVMCDFDDEKGFDFSKAGKLIVKGKEK